MRLSTRLFWQPKAGHQPAEYEDAYWPQQEVAGEYPQFSWAIADGASESTFAALWAHLLVRAYCRGWFSAGCARQRLTDLQNQWQTAVFNRQLSFFARRKAETEGAAAALLGITLYGDGTWQAVAAGDCCLFQVDSEGQLRSTFPLTASQSFSYRPRLLVSLASSLHQPCELQRARGSWTMGDRIYLLTDALAHWWLAAVEAGRKPWELVDAALEVRDMEQLVATLRNNKSLRNDDLTLLRIQLLLKEGDEHA